MLCELKQKQSNDGARRLGALNIRRRLLCCFQIAVHAFHAVHCLCHKNISEKAVSPRFAPGSFRHKKISGCLCRIAKRSSAMAKKIPRFGWNDS
jgi:hypothetical protein